MELCSTCKRVKCNRRIVVMQKNNLTITKCLEYEKDGDKIKGYTQPLWITARQSKALMDLNI